MIFNFMKRQQTEDAKVAYERETADLKDQVRRT